MTNPLTPVLKAKILPNGLGVGFDITPKYDPSKEPGSESGLELYALDDVEIRPFQQVLIPHGVAVEVPAGYETQIRPRSSAMGKKRAHVILGTIDNGYRGELMTSALYVPEFEVFDEKFVTALVQDWGPKAARGELSITQMQDHKKVLDTLVMLGLARFNPEPVVIKKGERISQLVVVQVAHAQVELVTDLSTTVRGSLGFSQGTGGYHG